MSALAKMFQRVALDALSLLPDSVLRAGARALFSKSQKRFEDATQRPREVQLERLMLMIERAKDTAFGKAHGFAEIKTLEDYRARVPIAPWDTFEPYIDRMLAGENGVLIPDVPTMFARSSGTTGKPKHVPVTEMYLGEYRVPRRVWALAVMQAFPGLIRGKFLSVHSPRLEGESKSGVPYGSITVAFGGEAGSPFDAVPRSVFLLEDAGLRYRTMLRLSLQHKITLAAAVNPSTLVLLAKKLDEYGDALARDLDAGTFSELDRLPQPIRGDVEVALRSDAKAAARIRASRAKNGRVLPTDVWPDIVGLLCWKGGSAPFWLEKLATLYPGREAMDYGFVATEGGFSLPRSTKSASGVASILGHFLEFVPEDDPSRVLLADELVPGKKYRVVITGSHGLYRYDINDIVECTGYYNKTAEIVFVHKGGNMLSITGEKIGERHVVQAIAESEASTGVRLAGFCIAPELRDPPRYVLAIEPMSELAPGAAEKFLDAFEQRLRNANIEYAAKRDSERLGSPILRVLPAGAFERERDRRVRAGAPDAHVKPLHLAPDLSIIDTLERPHV